MRTFKGELIIDHPMFRTGTIFFEPLTFTKGHILTRGNKEIGAPIPPELQGQPTPEHNEYVMRDGTRYNIEFLGDTKNEQGQYDDIRITYKDYRGIERIGYVMTDSKNHFKAKWMHKQTWLSQNFTTIIFTISAALLSSLLTYLFTTPSC